MASLVGTAHTVLDAVVHRRKKIESLVQESEGQEVRYTIFSIPIVWEKRPVRTVETAKLPFTQYVGRLEM
jgi:hypothetical protein